MIRSLPSIGAWYQDTEDGHRFEVVAIDEHAGTIEVQHFDGEIEEFDQDTWRLLPIRDAAEPGDWSAPYEVESAAHHEINGDIALDDWSDPLSKIEPHNLSEAIDALADSF